MPLLTQYLHLEIILHFTFQEVSVKASNISILNINITTSILVMKMNNITEKVLCKEKSNQIMMNYVHVISSVAVLFNFHTLLLLIVTGIANRQTCVFFICCS